MPFPLFSSLFHILLVFESPFSIFPTSPPFPTRFFVCVCVFVFNEFCISLPVPCVQPSVAEVKKTEDQKRLSIKFNNVCYILLDDCFV